METKQGTCSPAASVEGEMTPYLHSVGALFAKEIRTEWRNRELIFTLLTFALIVLVIFNFTFDLERTASAGNFSGMLWVTLAFAGTLGFSHGLGREKDRGSLSGLLLAPIDRSAILVAKMLLNWLVMLVVAVLLLPIGWILFNPGEFHWLLVPAVLLGTLGYAVTGTTISALVLHSRSRALLMPVLLLPVSIPLFLSAVKATEGVMEGAAAGEVRFWFEFLTGVVLIFLTTSMLLADTLFEE
jgi:heme exporter protein B